MKECLANVAQRLTHMVCEVGGGSREVVEVRLADVSLLYNQIDWHFALQAADVPVAEVITELVDLRNPVFQLDPPSFS